MINDSMELYRPTESVMGYSKREQSDGDDEDGCPDSMGSDSLQLGKKKWTRVGVPKFRCLVCGDGAYGNNFGLVTCESCKAFFRRQINRKQPFPCPGNSDCSVTSDTRKRCPACRLRKCYEVGMQPDIGEARRRRRRENERARQAARRSRLASLAAAAEREASDPQERQQDVAVPDCAPTSTKPVAFWLPRPLPTELFLRVRSVCEALVCAIEAPFEENEVAVLYANQSQFASSLPQTFTELQGLREATIRRFIRFAKALTEFREHFEFDERVAVLKRTLLACYVLHFGFTWDVQLGTRRVRFMDGREEIIDHDLVCMLKRKSGMDENDTNHKDYVTLHGAIRTRFPHCWPVVLSALSVATLFSPDGSANCNSDVDADTDFDHLPSTNVALALGVRLSAIRRIYIRFIVDFVEQMEIVPVKGRLLTPEERLTIATFCREQITYAYSIGENIAERLSSAVRLDPHTAIKIIPLLAELKSC